MTSTPASADIRVTHADDGTTSVEVSISIEAPVEVVFDFITVPEMALRWMGYDCEIDPRPGGTYRVRFTDDDVAVGEYVEVTPYTTVSWTWGWDGNEGLPPGSTLVTFTLARGETDDSTVVTVSHTGLPDESAATAHGSGWRFWGRRLAVGAAGGDPSTVEWED